VTVSPLAATLSFSADWERLSDLGSGQGLAVPTFLAGLLLDLSAEADVKREGNPRERDFQLLGAKAFLAKNLRDVIVEGGRHDH